MISTPTLIEAHPQICSASHGDISQDQVNQIFLGKMASASASIPMATPLVSAQGQLLFGNSVPAVPGLQPIALKPDSGSPMLFSEVGSEDSKFGNPNIQNLKEPAKKGTKRTLEEGRQPVQKKMKGAGLEIEDDSDWENNRSRARKGKQCNFAPDQVAVLKNWFQDHIDDPYPGPKTKENLCRQTGLSWKQVSDWFQNARCRAWSKVPNQTSVDALPIDIKEEDAKADKKGVKTDAAKPLLLPRQPQPPLLSKQSPLPTKSVAGQKRLVPSLQQVPQSAIQVPAIQQPPRIISAQQLPTQTISAIAIAAPELQMSATLQVKSQGGMPTDVKGNFNGIPSNTKTDNIPTVVAPPTVQTSPATTATGDNRLVRRRARLPRKARELLKKWFNEHLRYPYPTSNEKEMLQKQTGLTHRQIFNWFTNRRKRDPNWCPNKNPRSHSNADKSSQGKKKVAGGTGNVGAAGALASGGKASQQKKSTGTKKKPDLGSEAELLLALGAG